MPSMSDDPKPSFWRSLAELEGRPEFQELIEREFSAPVDEDALPGSPDRRRFMQLMGASFALGGLTVGCRWEKEEILPLTRRPEGMVPGESRAFASAMDLNGAGTGLLVTSVDGRPIKIEGNPKHPDSRGAAGIFHQASLLEMYDPDRATHLVRRASGDQRSDWTEFERWLAEHSEFAADGGAGLAVLAEPSSSSVRGSLETALRQRYPRMRWVNWSADYRDHELLGAKLAFGQSLRTLHRLDRAAVVLTLDADPFSPEWPAFLANIRQAADGRAPDDTGEMSRFYAVESAFSLAGGLADHRLPLASSRISAFAAALDALLSERLGAAAASHGPAQPTPRRDWLKDERVAKFLAQLADDLLAARGKSVVLVGRRQPPEVHALAHRLNALLDAPGKTLSYVAEPAVGADYRGSAVELAELTTAMNAGAVGALFVLGGNPLLDAPSDLGLSAAMSKVEHRVRLGLYDDETAAQCSWLLPRAHYLESWGDVRGWDGTIALQQPLILPLYQGRSDSELLALLLGEKPATGRELLRKYVSGLSDERAMRRAVHDGVLAGTAFALLTPTLASLPKLNLRDEGLAPDELELVLVTDSNLLDGRYANLSWLMELPDPMTKVTWANVACIAPKTAAALHIGEGERIELEVNGRTVTVPAIYSPGQAEGSLKLALGWGRERAGHVGGLAKSDVPPVGVNAYPLRTSKSLTVQNGLRVRPTGEKAVIASTQDLHAIDQRGREGRDSRLGMIVREATLGQFKTQPDFAEKAVHHPPLLQMWQSPVSYDGHKWGLSIDLGKCIGCNACMVACQAENNIPVVGKDNVVRGREMHWIRVDRYYKGSPEAPEVAFQPVSCQHCENAPCEQVCPVGATMHSSEGLNEMTYNRCIGTRYCSNNCPYKVRRFNFFNYHLDLKQPENQVKKMVFNPEVTVRSRGVMEKCTFCVQRIQKVKIKAKNARRALVDGEIVTACQQTCPAGAIVFGDLNDPKALVARNQKRPRSYVLLEELNDRPRVKYLARIRNPKPELA